MNFLNISLKLKKVSDTSFELHSQSNAMSNDCEMLPVWMEIDDMGDESASPFPIPVPQTPLQKTRRIPKAPVKRRKGVDDLWQGMNVPPRDLMCEFNNVVNTYLRQQ